MDDKLELITESLDMLNKTLKRIAYALEAHMILTATDGGLRPKILERTHGLGLGWCVDCESNIVPAGAHACQACGAEGNEISFPTATQEHP